MNLSNDLIPYIFNNLNFDNLLLFKKTNNELNKIVKNYSIFARILKIKASNYIKFVWMNYKIINKDCIICRTKINNIKDLNYNVNLDNLICIYDKKNNTNLMYSNKCKEYIKKKCFIINCILKDNKKLEKQFICLDFHPYTKLYLRNEYPDYFNNLGENSYNLILFSDNIYFNKLNKRVTNRL